MAGACILLPIHAFEIKNFNKLRLKAPRTIRKELHLANYEKNAILM